MNSSGRTDKHRHILDDALGLDRDQLALLAVMMLRGPQSAGELRTRTERYSTSQGTGFESIHDIEAVLAQLAEGVDPFVANIGRASGQSQDRWAHLLGDVVPDIHDVSTGPCGSTRQPRSIAGTARGGPGGAACSAGIRTRGVCGTGVMQRFDRLDAMRTGTLWGLLERVLSACRLGSTDRRGNTAWRMGLITWRCHRSTTG